VESLYSRRSNLVLGFHGCDKSVAENVIGGKMDLTASKNDYDWLGHGIYFWENNQERALQWANDMTKRANSSVKSPAVIGAIIDLGYCFDLTDSFYLNELKQAYQTLAFMYHQTGRELPKNTVGGSSEDILIRKLDCAVIQMAHILNKEANHKAYDSVKGVFWEGKPLYPAAGFREKNHIQICVCNPNCIKGYFFPKSINDNYTNP
jgi:hypothetical protein